MVPGMSNYRDGQKGLSVTVGKLASLMQSTTITPTSVALLFQPTIHPVFLLNQIGLAGMASTITGDSTVVCI
jgi:hypothetical protein